MNMPTTHSLQDETKDDGSTSKKLVVEFSNGSLEQLKDLAEFFKLPDNDPYSAINLAIGVLEKIKENNQKPQTPSDK